MRAILIEKDACLNRYRDFGIRRYRKPIHKAFIAFGDSRAGQCTIHHDYVAALPFLTVMFIITITPEAELLTITACANREQPQKKKTTTRSKKGLLDWQRNKPWTQARYCRRGTRSMRLTIFLVTLTLVAVLSMFYVDATDSDENHRRMMPAKQQKRAPGPRHGANFATNAAPVEIERSILKREMQRSNQAYNLLKSIHGYDHIQGFYHTSKWRTFWKEVISEQLLLLDGRRPIPEKNVERHTNVIPWDMDQYYTSLLNMSTGLYLNVVGPDKSHMEEVSKYVDSLGLRFRDKIQINFNRTIGRYQYDSGKPEQKKAWDNDNSLSSGEFSTIMTLRNYCIDQVKAGKKTLVYYIQSKGQCCQRNVTKDTPPQNEGMGAHKTVSYIFSLLFTICLLYRRLSMA